MIRQDYSADINPLREIEIYDYDTKDQHETGINHGRMRLPTRYDISKYYNRDWDNPTWEDEWGNMKFENGEWEQREKELVDFGGKDFNWQITYSFPSTRRDPRTANGGIYGGQNVTFRRLYLILCERLNGGRFFIDDYFKSVYPHTIKHEVDEQLNRIKEELLSVANEEYANAVFTKSGKLDRRYRINKDIKDNYESFAEAWENDEGIYLAQMIKEDIISCLMTGQIPLATHQLATETRKARIKAGLSSDPRFFATAQLIESIQLYVTIGGNGKWQTDQGILV